MLSSQLLSILASLGGALAAPAAPALKVRDGSSAVVNFNNNTGTPYHLASGILYGVPDQQGQIPDQFYTDMGFNYLRAGGAQLGAPARGWIWGVTEYENRFASVLSNYKTAREHGAPFIFLIHDLYGCDSTQNSSTPYPGDNGDWTYYDNYLSHLFADIQANNMQDGLIIDIWNEPDQYAFWQRSQDQYNEMYTRVSQQFRNTFGSSVQLSGPALSGQPDLGNSWWTSWAAAVSQANVAPDQYAWHMEGGGGDMLTSYGALCAIQAQYNLPPGIVNVNEYATYAEQVPAGAAWWISQLERVDAQGLRGNWLSANQLHDFLASLLSKPGAPDTYSATGTGYFPNGEYQVYKYYNQNMTGYRVGTLPSPDYALDVYSTVDTNEKVARVLVGVRLQTGTWYVQLNSLSSLGLPSSGTLNIHTYGFTEPNGDRWTEVDGPNDLGYYGHPYSDDTVTFPIFQNDKITSYAFEFSLP